MQALPPASVEFPKEISFPAGDRGFLVGEAIVEEVKDAGEGIDSVVMDDDGMAVFQSLKQRLRFIFQPWNTIMAYVKDDKRRGWITRRNRINRGSGGRPGRLLYCSGFWSRWAGTRSLPNMVLEIFG